MDLKTGVTLFCIIVGAEVVSFFLEVYLRLMWLAISVGQ